MSIINRRDRWSNPPPGPLLKQEGVYVSRRVQGIQHLAMWKNEPGGNLWLRRLVGTLFQSFVTSALPGQPAAEMLPHTAQLWVDVLLDMNLTEADAERVQMAGRKLLRELEEWPQVKALIAAMPRRITARPSPESGGGVVSAETVPTDADRAASRAHLRKIREML